MDLTTFVNFQREQPNWLTGQMSSVRFAVSISATMISQIGIDGQRPLEFCDTDFQQFYVIKSDDYAIFFYFLIIIIKQF